MELQLPMVAQGKRHGYSAREAGPVRITVPVLPSTIEFGERTKEAMTGVTVIDVDARLGRL